MNAPPAGRGLVLRAGGRPDHAATGGAPHLGAAGGVRVLGADARVVLLLADIAPAARLWGWGRFITGRAAARAEAGVCFAKVLGSGHDGGFGLRPSGSRQGLFCVLRDAAAAEAFVQCSPLVRAYREHAREFALASLRVTSCRGSWAGVRFEPVAEAPPQGRIAALTRASIRPQRAARFWRHAPPSQRALSEAPGCVLAVGLGEAPLLRQATFSIWQDVDSMRAYAHTGAHRLAIDAAREHGLFSESMFARFVVDSLEGSWRGVPLG